MWVHRKFKFRAYMALTCPVLLLARADVPADPDGVDATDPDGVGASDPGRVDATDPDGL